MPDTIALTDTQRAFLRAPKRFAALATTDEDGTPRQTVIWYRLLADDRILVNGRSPRRWCANLDRTGRRRHRDPGRHRRLPLAWPRLRGG